MKHKLALNPNRNPNKGMAYSYSLNEYDELTKRVWLKKMIDDIRQGHEELKNNLPFRCAHYAQFADNKRNKKSMQPMSFLFQTTVDVDDMEYVDKAREGALALNEQDGPWKGMLLHMDLSARDKLHIDVRMPIGKTIEETQREYCSLLGIPFDESCITPERFIYITDERQELYRSELWYAILPEEELRERRLAFQNRGLSIDGRGEVKEDILVMPEVTTAEQPSEDAEYDNCYDGIPYENIVNALIDQLGGIPAHGSRNQFIYSIACCLRHICNDDPDWIAHVLPTFGEARPKWWKTIKSACSRSQSRTMPLVVQRAIRQARLMTVDSNEPDKDWPMPVLPNRLPPVIELLTSKVPNHYKPAVAQAVFSPLAAHLFNVKFRYIDQQTHEPTVMTVLMAPQSIGKGCVNKPIEYIMADIKARDEQNRQREQEWKDKCNSKGSNKEKPLRPENLTVQYTLSDMTNAALVQRLKDANGRFLYCKMNEIELLNKLKTNGKDNDVSELIRLAWDTDDYGQERVGTQSVTARTQVRWNWNASTTIERGKKFFKDGLSDGTLSRICLSTIIEPDDYDELIPIYGTYDSYFAEMLAIFIERLNAAHGEILCAEADALARELLRKNKRFAALSDDESFKTLSYRSNVQAFIKAMVLYICDGMQWSKEIEDFVRWSEDYDLWCKMHFFSEQMNEVLMNENSHTKPGPRNMLDMLPDNFEEKDLQELRALLGKTRACKSNIRVWIHRGFIAIDTETGRYKKTNLYQSLAKKKA